MMRDIRSASVHFIVLFAALVSLLAAGCVSDSTSNYTYQPPQQTGDGFDVGTLDEVGMNPALIAKAVGGIENGRYGEVHSMLIFKDNLLVFEEYFPGHEYKWDGPNFHGGWVTWDRDTEHDIASVGKSITSACVGIAIEEGFIESVDEPMFAYLPEYQHLETAGKDQITIEHLVTMTSGLEWDELGPSLSDTSNDLVALWFCDDPLACILENPLVSEPGADFTYNSGNTVLLGAIIKNATGKYIEAFSAEYLFKPMGIDPVAWRWINDDVIYAGGGQRMTPREMLKFGVTYLNHGLWDGQQIVGRGQRQTVSRPG